MEIQEKKFTHFIVLCQKEKLNKYKFKYLILKFKKKNVKIKMSNFLKM